MLGEIVRLLPNTVEDAVDAPQKPEFLSHGPVAIYFPGQGYQFTGMGKPEYDKYDFVRNLHAIANNTLGYSITDIMHNTEREGELKSLRYGQPAILVDVLGKFLVLKHHYPEVETPVAFGGLSFGEFCALVASGAVDFRDMLRIVDTRGEGMQRTGDLQAQNGQRSGVLKISLKVSEDGLVRQQRMHFGSANRALRAEGLEFGYFYNERTIGLGGTDEQIERGIEVMKEYEQYGVKAERIEVPLAFHTSHVSSVVAGVADAVKDISIHKPHTPVMINRTARLTSDPDVIREEIPRHTDNPVNLVGAIRRLRKHNLANRLIEVGSRPIVVALTKGPDERRVAVKTPDGAITLGFALVPTEQSA